MAGLSAFTSFRSKLRHISRVQSVVNSIAGSLHLPSKLHTQKQSLDCRMDLSQLPTSVVYLCIPQISHHHRGLISHCLKRQKSTILYCQQHPLTSQSLIAKEYITGPMGSRTTYQILQRRLRMKSFPPLINLIGCGRSIVLSLVWYSQYFYE